MPAAIGFVMYTASGAYMCRFTRVSHALAIGLR